MSVEAAAGKRQRLATRQPIPQNSAVIRVQTSDPSLALERVLAARQQFLVNAHGESEEFLRSAQVWMDAEAELQTHFRDVRVRAPSDEEVAALGSVTVSIVWLAQLLAVCSLDPEASSEQWWREQLELPAWSHGEALSSVVVALLALQNQPMSSVQERSHGAWV